MKILISLLALNIGITTNAQKFAASKVPTPVKSAFAKACPGVTATWESEKGNYEAGYKKDGIQHSNLYAPNGKLMETEITIEKEGLPAPAWQYVKQHFKTPIQEAAKITKADGTITYEAEVAKMDLIFDAEGKYVRTEND